MATTSITTFFPSRKAPLQPPPYRHIVEFKAYPSQGNAGKHEGKDCGNGFAERQVVALCIGKAGVEKGKMNDVKRIRDVAKKVTYTRRKGIGGFTRCAQPHHKRKNQQHTKGFVDAVCPHLAFSA